MRLAIDIFCIRTLLNEILLGNRKMGLYLWAELKLLKPFFVENKIIKPYFCYFESLKRLCVQVHYTFWLFSFC